MPSTASINNCIQIERKCSNLYIWTPFRNLIRQSGIDANVKLSYDYILDIHCHDHKASLSNFLLEASELNLIPIKGITIRCMDEMSPQTYNDLKDFVKYWWTFSFDKLYLGGGYYESMESFKDLIIALAPLAKEIEFSYFTISSVHDKDLVEALRNAKTITFDDCQWDSSYEISKSPNPIEYKLETLHLNCMDNEEEKISQQVLLYYNFSESTTGSWTACSRMRNTVQSELPLLTILTRFRVYVDGNPRTNA